MNSSAFDSAFDATRWEHWLLIASFLSLAVYGLRLSWQWRRAAKRRQRTVLARRLAIEASARRLDSLSAQISLSRQTPLDAKSLDARSLTQATREKANAAYSSSARQSHRHLNADI